MFLDYVFQFGNDLYFLIFSDFEGVWTVVHKTGYSEDISIFDNLESASHYILIRSSDSFQCGFAGRYFKG